MISLLYFHKIILSIVLSCCNFWIYTHLGILKFTIWQFCVNFFQVKTKDTWSCVYYFLLFTTNINGSMCMRWQLRNSYYYLSIIKVKHFWYVGVGLEHVWIFSALMRKKRVLLCDFVMEIISLTISFEKWLSKTLALTHVDNFKCNDFKNYLLIYSVE